MNMNGKTERADAVCTAIEKAANECGLVAIRDLPKFAQAIQMAKGIRDMRLALTDDFVKHALMPLQGTTLGFLTDKDKNKDGSPGPGYPLATVRECAIEAMIRGLNVVGNEFNIIADRCYGTKNGYARLVREFPGLTHLVLTPGVPTFAGEKGALVPFTATWKLNGKPDSIECQAPKEGPDTRIPVKVNAGMGYDAILGKAERKMLFRIYQRVNGSSFGATEGEVGDEGAINTTGEPAPSPVPAGAVEGRRYSIGKNGKKQPAGDQPAATGAAAPATEARASTPPPRESAPAAAPVELVDRARLLQMLREVDPAWDDPDFAALDTIASWTEAECAEAFRWCDGYLNNVQRNIRRPQHTSIVREREPGEEG